MSYLTAIQKKLDYAYRYTVATLIIQRLRLNRRIRNFRGARAAARKSRTKHESWVKDGAIAALFLGACALAYVVGAQQNAEALQENSTVAKVATVLELPPESEPRVLGVGSVALPPAIPEPILLTTPPKKVALQEAQQEGTVKSLRSVVEYLTRQVSELEEETLGLESKLLEQQIGFSIAQQQWEDESVERKVVYNITNVPVGGYVGENAIQGVLDNTNLQNESEKLNYSELDDDELSDDELSDDELSDDELSDDELEDKYLTEIGNDSEFLPVVDDVDPYEHFIGGARLNEQWVTEEDMKNAVREYEQFNREQNDSGYWQNEAEKLRQQATEHLIQGRSGNAASFAVELGSANPTYNSGYASEGNSAPSSFFGPAEDQHNNLVSPGMATSPSGEN